MCLFKHPLTERNNMNNLLTKTTIYRPSLIMNSVQRIPVRLLSSTMACRSSFLNSSKQIRSKTSPSMQTMVFPVGLSIGMISTSTKSVSRSTSFSRMLHLTVLKSLKGDVDAAIRRFVSSSSIFPNFQKTFEVFGKENRGVSDRKLPVEDSKPETGSQLYRHIQREKLPSVKENPSENSTMTENNRSSLPSSKKNSAWSFYFIVAANLIVLLVWQIAKYQYEKQNDPALLGFMFMNFSSNLNNLFQGRFWTLFTPCISHIDFTHLALNMLTFAFFAPAILPVVGNVAFLGFYFGAGFFANAASLYLKANGIGHLNEYSNSLGASGSTVAMVTAFSLVQPRATLLLFFIIPLPAWVLMPGLIAYDVWGILSEEPNRALWDRKTVIDSAGHLAGAVAGWIFWTTRLRRLRFR